MKAGGGVMGICSRELPVIQAVEQLHQRGYEAVEIFSPFGSEELLGSLPLGKSPIRFYTLAGAFLGFLFGLGFTTWTALSWPLLTGGKPIVSVPPYLIIAFELTILFGGLFTLGGWLLHARLPRVVPGTGQDACFPPDKFRIFVACESQQASEVRQLLLAVGLEEVSLEAT